MEILSTGVQMLVSEKLDADATKVSPWSWSAQAVVSSDAETATKQKRSTDRMETCPRNS